MLGTDLGFVGYWTAVAAGGIPPSPNPVLVAWNWSFVVLDLLASTVGLTALWLIRRGATSGRGLRLVSLALTQAAGLTAVSFWALRADFQLEWWLPNLWLTAFPVVAMAVLLSRSAPAAGWTPAPRARGRRGGLPGCAD